MFMVIKKKYISVFLVLLICLTFGLIIKFSIDDKSYNVVQNDEFQSSNSELPDIGETIAVSAEPNTTIAKAKNDRDMVRSKSCELLVELIENENVSQQSKQEAEAKLIKNAEYMDCENKCESLIFSKGFGECVVFCVDESVTVTLVKNNLTDVDIAKINDIIFEQTGNNNIKIVEVR